MPYGVTRLQLVNMEISSPMGRWATQKVKNLMRLLPRGGGSWMKAITYMPQAWQGQLTSSIFGSWLNDKSIHVICIGSYMICFRMGCEEAKRNIYPLRTKFFRGNINHIFTFYVIPSHWYDTVGGIPSSNKTRTYPFYIVNIMAAGVLATQGARTSAAMILT